MTGRRAGAALILLALTPAACGGGSRRATTATTAAQPTGSAPAATVAPTPTATVAPAPQASGGGAPAPQAHAEVPALFTVAPGGALVPPKISVPAGLPVALTIVSRDGRSHTLALKGGSPRTLKVAAGDQASVLITGLRPGTYAVELDGAARGSLFIGAQPGP